MGYSLKFDRLVGQIENDRRMNGIRGRHGDSSFVIDGVPVFLSPDAEADRVAFWTQLAGLAPNETHAAAALTCNFNAQHFHERGMSMGISLAQRAVIVGRSVEIDEMDVDGVDALLDHVARQFPFAQQFLNRGLERHRAEERVHASSLRADNAQSTKVRRK